MVTMWFRLDTNYRRNGVVYFIEDLNKSTHYFKFFTRRGWREERKSAGSYRYFIRINKWNKIRLYVDIY